MLKALAPLAIVSILAATSASAGPAASSLLQLKSVMPADTVQVEDRGWRGERRGEYRRGRDHNYTAGRRYDRAPSLLSPPRLSSAQLAVARVHPRRSDMVLRIATEQPNQLSRSVRWLRHISLLERRQMRRRP